LLEEWKIFITDTNGFIYSVDDNMKIRSCDLKLYLDEPLVEDFSLELVCADLSNFECQASDKNRYLATCWLYYDDCFRPRRYLFSFFQMTSKFEFKQCKLYNQYLIQSF
jgi:hypothetical protein